VAERIKLENPSDGAMHVSHETIYTWFYFCRRVN